MDPVLVWFAEASCSNACDFIGQGISEFRKVVNDEAQKRQRARQQVEMAAASGQMSAADKTRFDTADAWFEEQKKINDQYDDALIVLAVLGSRLVGLDVVNQAEIAAANNTIRQAFAGVTGSNYFARFDRLARSVQIGVICGMIFCAECYPMHIWRGFGAAVRSEFDWATFWETKEPWDLLDRSISFLKSSPKSFSLLKKQVEGIERQKPWWRSNEKQNNAKMWSEGKKERKALEDARKDFNKRIEKKGFPLPNDNAPQITTWSIPFATWDSPFVISNEGHSWTNVLRHQMDPGRLLHAFMIGGHLNLSQGEAMIIPTLVAQSVVRWLEGLNGMTFKTLPEAAFNFKKIGLSSSTKKAMQSYGVRDIFAVQDPAALARKNQSAPITTQSQTPAPAFIPQMPPMQQTSVPSSPSNEVPPPQYFTTPRQPDVNPAMTPLTPQTTRVSEEPQVYVVDHQNDTYPNPHGYHHPQTPPTGLQTKSFSVEIGPSEGLMHPQPSQVSHMPYMMHEKRMSVPMMGTPSMPTMPDPRRVSMMDNSMPVRRRPAPNAPPMPAFLSES